MKRLTEAALDKARDGLRHLSPTEAEILAIAVEGQSAVVIGKQLGSSPRTVEKHREHILTKCGAANMIAGLGRDAEEPQQCAGGAGGAPAFSRDPPRGQGCGNGRVG